MYSVEHIASIIDAELLLSQNAEVRYLLTDSRKLVFAEYSLFFALSGDRRDGHLFVEELYAKGVLSFVVHHPFNTTAFPNANFLKVANVLDALQRLATYHRKQFSLPVIGITGSNGKTTVKEWLNELLHTQYNIVRSPRSYNSQIGVPLSVWEMAEEHNLAIIEAGISRAGEMQHLEKIIQPTIGVLTAIGDAHKEGFINLTHKRKEKLGLFKGCKQVVVCLEDLDNEISDYHTRDDVFSWSRVNQQATVWIAEEVILQNQALVQLHYQEKVINLTLPFSDKASINNAITACCVMLLLGVQVETIVAGIAQLQPVEMRMQLKQSFNNCSVINDSYSNDLSSLSIALDFLKQQSGSAATTVVLSDFLQTGTVEVDFYKELAQLLNRYKINRLIAIGKQMGEHRQFFESAIAQTHFFSDTDALLRQLSRNQFHNEYILIKGARVFAFEQINAWFEQKVHKTLLEINLNALTHNLKQYQNILQPTTRMMVMVKAFGYGNGGGEIARLLQFNKVDYLAVAYADEGVELRHAGVSLPIMVMNADEAAFNTLVEYGLEPEIYSVNIYKAFHSYLQKQALHHFPVHIKINTGMNRLGFELEEVEQLGKQLIANKTMVVKSVFSHLVGSEDAEGDDFTQKQASTFDAITQQLSSLLGYKFIRHIANSSAIVRHPNLQFDMVRLGIGLYGVDSSRKLDLQTVATLKSTIAQIRSVNASDTVGYNRKGVLDRDSRIATIRIGYADGFSRRLGNRCGAVYLRGQKAPVVGNVCMDMIMVDVTDIPDANEGDEVEIFGNHISVKQVAQQCNTIAYEIMTSISQRVPRIFTEE